MATKTKPKARDKYKGQRDPNYSFEWEAQRHYKSRYGWRKWERVGMRPEMDLDELVLNWTEKPIPDLDIQGAITSININRSIEKSSTITLELLDPDRVLFKKSVGRVEEVPRLTKKQRRRVRPIVVDEHWKEVLSPHIIGKPVELWLDNVAFRLVAVEHTWGDGRTLLTFEDRVIYWLRRKRGARSARRDRFTRAEFILSQLREIKHEKIPFICPELHKDQPIVPMRRTGKRGAGFSEPDYVGDYGGNINRVFPAHEENEKQAQLSETQVRACAAAGGFYGRELDAMVDLCNKESTRRPGVINEIGAIGLWQMYPEGWGVNSQAYRWMQELGGEAEMRNPVKNAVMAHRLYVAAGYQFTPWEATTSIPPGPGPGASRAEALELAERVLGGTSDEFGDRPGTQTSEVYIKSYLFTRDKRENAWQSMTRLAEEVNWRLFVVGRAMYYMSEEDLYLRPVRYVVKPDDPSLNDMSFNMHWGRKVSEATLNVNLDRWGAPPGSLVELRGFGPPDGRWLVRELDRDWFAPNAEITLTQPSPSKKEPTPDVEERSTGDIGGRVTGGSVRGMNPGDIIDQIVLPIANAVGISRSVSENNAANASHGPTISGGVSDHQGPRSERWAADMSNGSAPTPEMDKLARTLTSAFGLTPNNDGWSAGGTWSGFRYQLLYRTNTGGNHFNHVHFGIARA